VLPSALLPSDAAMFTAAMSASNFDWDGERQCDSSKRSSLRSSLLSFTIVVVQSIKYNDLDG
jgi:hypothetical protein